MTTQRARMTKQAHWHVLAVILLLFTGPVFARDYFWSRSGDSTKAVSPSAFESCQLLGDQWSSGSQGIYGPVTTTGVIYTDEVTANCVWHYYQLSGQRMPIEKMVLAQVARNGDNCPSDTQYDPAVTDGSTQCVPLPEEEEPEAPCEPLAGQTTSFVSVIPGYVSSGGHSGIGEFGCLSACRVSITSMQCSASSDGSDSGACYGIGKFSGESCQAGDPSFGDYSTGEPDPNDPPTDPQPDPDDSDPTDPANKCGPDYVWSGTTCVPKPGDDGGNGSGGDGDGNGGGGSGGGGDSGSGSGDGSGSGSGDGSGSGSGGTGEGNGEGNGDGDGDGDGEGEGDESVGESDGPGSNLKAPEGTGSFDEGIAEWEERIAQIREELDEKIEQYSGLFSGVFDLNLGGGAGSLPCYHFSVMGQSASLCISDYSEYLINLRYVLLLVAAVIAAFVILRN